MATLGFADTDVLMAYHDWSLPDHWPKLGADEFAIREKARSFEIDLDGRRVTWQFAREPEPLVLDARVEGWTPEALALSLDRQVRKPDISQGGLLKWLSDVIGHLLNVRGVTLAALLRCKFLLASKIEGKIKAVRQQSEAFLTGISPPRTLSGVAGFSPPFKPGTGYAPGSHP